MTDKEKNLARLREYYSRPDVKERRKKYYQDPERKKKQSIRGEGWRKKYKDRIENDRLVRLYGITLEGYTSLFEKQEGKCAICKTHQLDLKKKLHIDHCHTTGTVRGLLCFNCNIGLGYFKDNEVSLKQAAEYVSMYSWD